MNDIYEMTKMTKRIQISQKNEVQYRVKLLGKSKMHFIKDSELE